MHMKTCGQEDAISDIDRPVGERSNEEFIPAWVRVAKVGVQKSGHDIQGTNEKEKGKEVRKLGSLSI